MPVCLYMKKDSSEIEFNYFPQPIDKVQMQMWTNEGSIFDDKAEAYLAKMWKEEKPVRSRHEPGGPY